MADRKKAKPGPHEIHFEDKEAYDRAYVNQVLHDSGKYDPLPQGENSSSTVSFGEIEAHAKGLGIVVRKQKRG